MRLLIGWTFKLAFAALLYFGVAGNWSIKMPDTVLGLRVPDAIRRSVEAPNQLRAFAAQTQNGFKKLSDALAR